MPKLNGKHNDNSYSQAITTSKTLKQMKLNKNLIPKNSKSDHNLNLSKQVVDFHNEIIKYHLMKNKIYILCATKTKLYIYNIMKLKKIAEFNINYNSTFEKMIEIFCIQFVLCCHLINTFDAKFKPLYYSSQQSAAFCEARL